LSAAATQNLSIIPALSIKLGYETQPGKTKDADEVSRFFDDIANLSQNKHQPYVGEAPTPTRGACT
jgi:isopropylmalate/homocitrate/citramalate synthase